MTSSKLFRVYVKFLGIATEQANMWAESIDDTAEAELEARQGGLTPTHIDPKLLCDIQ